MVGDRLFTDVLAETDWASTQSWCARFVTMATVQQGPGPTL